MGIIPGMILALFPYIFTWQGGKHFSVPATISNFSLLEDKHDK